MANQKYVKVKVGTETELSEVEALETKVNKLKLQRLQLKIDADTQKLNEANERIESLRIFLDNVNKGNTNINIDDDQIKKAEAELASLEQKQIGLEIDVETGKLEAAKVEVEELDDEEIEIQLRNQSAMEAIDQIGQGFDRLKQGASEVGQQMGSVLESAGRMEQTEAFLSMNIGADQAKQKLEEIRSVTDQLPGDDVTLQNLLSQAAVKDATMGTEAFKQMGNAAADYMAAMQNYGKSSTETQQDLMNYILAGNTAELAKSPILQDHIDKLKEGTTVQERSQLLAEAINQEGWGGIANQDIYNNKLQSFNDMLERGKTKLGDVFLKGSEGAMDFLMNLDESTNGLVGMSVALGGFASPMFDTLSGLSQIALGMKAIKDLGFVKYLKDLEIFTKLSAAADWILAGAQQVLNFVMYENPIILVVIALVALAAALIWAYYNVDWFREMVDNAWASIVQFATGIWNTISPAIDWLSNLFQNFTSQLGLNSNDWLQAILGFILFIPQLPLQIGIALTNALARLLGFKGNFVQSMIKTASDAVNGFIKYITQLPGIVMGEFNRVLGLVNDFINSIPSRVWDMGAAIIGALKSALGIGSPGHMFYMIEGEFNRIDDLTSKTRFDTGSIGQDMVNSFNPNISSSGGNAGDGGVTQVNNFYFNDTVVDDDKRMERIADYITRKLSFDNATAGRSV